MINYDYNYNSMDNMYGYNGSNLQYGMYTSNLNNVNPMACGYCPYRTQYGSPMDYQRYMYSYNPGFYQYSPAVNCITPAYGAYNGYDNSQASAYNGELRMRTVKIQDVVD